MADKRFTGEQFERKQEETRARRLSLLPVLSLNNDHVDWFEAVTKKSSSAFGGNVQELNDISNLDVVSPITLDSTPTPIEVLNNARGTVIYKSKFILVKSSSYNEEIITDSFSVTENDELMLELEGKGPTAVPLSNLSFQEYHEGTLVRVIRANGVTLLITNRNLVPRGVKAPRTASGALCEPTKSGWIHKPGRFGADHTVPFSTTFDSIIEQIEPRFYDEGFLFPEDCEFSPICYRFVVVTRNIARANHRKIGPMGYLVYLGHSAEWTQSQWKSTFPNESYGTWHEESDVPEFPGFVKNYPKDLEEAYVLDGSESKSMEDHFADAVDILEGNNVRDIITSGTDLFGYANRHNCGGKLIVNAKFRIGPKFFTRVIHISSKAWKFREELLGNTPDLYSQFVSLMSANSRPFVEMLDPDAIGFFMSRYPLITVPISKEDIDTLEAAIESGKDLVAEFREVPYLYEIAKDGKLHREIWFNFILAANPSIRRKVFKFWLRYFLSIKDATLWLLKNQETKFKEVKWREEKEGKDKKRVLAFMKKLKRDIAFKTDEEKTIAVIDALRNGGNKSAYVLNVAVNYSGSKKKEIETGDWD